PIPGVSLLLYDGKGNPILNSAGKQLTAVTDSTGFYQFTGLSAGTYIVRELQPGGFIDSLDTPGTTGGTADNINTPQSTIPALPFNPNFDVIVNISLGVGQNSQSNNFSEVVTTRITIPPPPQFPPPPPLVVFPAIPSPQPIPQLVLPILRQPPVLDLGGGDALGFTWHLSMIDGGAPRGPSAQYVAMNFASASLAQVDWSNLPTIDAEWVLLDSNGNEVHRHVIGFKNAIPLAGDFLGDGIDELGLYVEGQWFIDLNGNGVWDAGDLWAKLGTRDDKPVVGDWNGDGKSDIGIWGPAWPRDPHAIQTDPGLADPENKLVYKRKNNMPPAEEDATSGRRVLQPGQQAKAREDLIDHVFHFGVPLETPVTGDWTGAGIRRIGTFYKGTWNLDTDGDGRLTAADATFEFGQAGDIPVVGDWTGDGIEKVGVYRNGAWYLDTNNNHRLDPSDRVIVLGQPGDVPVVGNFNGDGKANVGIYHILGNTGGPAAKTAAVPATTSAK
ncbi:MAG TPA: SpaA isopeptide-forming pilin-related protein, partial [Pirellulales bacterium]